MATFADGGEGARGGGEECFGGGRVGRWRVGVVGGVEGLLGADDGEGGGDEGFNGLVEFRFAELGGVGISAFEGGDNSIAGSADVGLIEPSDEGAEGALGGVGVLGVADDEGGEIELGECRALQEGAVVIGEGEGGVGVGWDLGQSGGVVGVHGGLLVLYMYGQGSRLFGLMQGYERILFG